MFQFSDWFMVYRRRLGYRVEKGTFDIEMRSSTVVIEATETPQKHFANLRMSQITLNPLIWTLVNIITVLNVVAEFTLLFLMTVS